MNQASRAPDPPAPAVDEHGRAPATRTRVELMHVPEPADRSFVVRVRRQLADARIGARMLANDLTAT